MKVIEKKLEILAPAGNMQSFYSAINNGADAIYLGLKDFNARGNVENFSLEDLQKVVDYAHLFDVKIYLTLNILVKTSEMADVLKTVEKAYEIGVDAFILQDLGLATLIKKFFPEAILHASTQMGIHNLEGAKFIEKLGFKRVVLSRETPIREIKRIKSGTNLEIEYFVQGALCVSFSGNCYLCSLLTNNSGNRGKCQQFCRLPYNLEFNNQQKKGYFLSAKDFCMIDKLKELSEAGVISFKIEGRARRPAYVAQSVKTYKKAIENHFSFTEGDVFDLKKVFNRGDYCQGYFNDEKIIYPNIQGHKGVKIGKVDGVKRGKRFNEILIKSSHKIAKGDGLKFILNNKEICSIGVFDVWEENGRYIITTTTDVIIGSEVYLTLDFNSEKNLLNTKKKLNIKGVFVAKRGERAKLKIFCKDNEACVEGLEIVEEAKTSPTDPESIKRQLLKLGDSVFEFEDLFVEAENVFLRKAQINELRRKAVDALEKELLKKYKINKKKNNININYISLKKQSQDKKLIMVDKLDKLKNIDDFKNKKIIYSPENYAYSDILNFYEYATKNNIFVYLDLPIFAEEKDISFYKKILEKTDIGIVANNLYAFDLCEPKKIIAGMGLNIFNEFTADFFAKFGVEDIVLSKELKIDEVNEFNCNKTLYSFAFGREEYMLFRHCPFKEFFGSSCNKCNYCNGLTYKADNNKKLLLFRKKAISCEFLLKSFEIKDLREKLKINQYIEI